MPPVKGISPEVCIILSLKGLTTDGAFGEDMICIALGMIRQVIDNCVFFFNELSTLLAAWLKVVAITIFMIGFAISCEIIPFNGFIAIAAGGSLCLNTSPEEGNDQ
jgi:Na+-translocating ferredoxin:NAD+ oxidoreductase RnfE subunit